MYDDTWMNLHWVKMHDMHDAYIYVCMFIEVYLHA